MFKVCIVVQLNDMNQELLVNLNLNGKCRIR